MARNTITVLEYSRVFRDWADCNVHLPPDAKAYVRAFVGELELDLPAGEYAVDDLCGIAERRWREDRKAGHGPQNTLMLTDIYKSNYLARRLYGGEPHRTDPCPKHHGKWSGIFGACEHGCELTGWLRPRQET